MKKLASGLLASVFLLMGSANAGAASCTGYDAIGYHGGCSGAGAFTYLGFYTCDASYVSASATIRGAGGTNSFVPVPDPQACSIYPQGQGWGAEAATAQTAGDGQTDPVNIGSARASADLHLPTPVLTAARCGYLIRMLGLTPFICNRAEDDALHRSRTHPDAHAFLATPDPEATDG